MQRTLAWIVIACLALPGCKDVTGTFKTTASTKDKDKMPPTATSVDATELVGDYKAGESTADGKYKGKELHVKGTVQSVRPGVLTLKGSTDGTQNVRCSFTKDAADSISKVKKGDEVKVEGQCKGKQSGTSGSFDVNLEGCKLVK